MNVKELKRENEDIPVIETSEIKDESVSERQVVQLVSFLLDEVEYGIDILKVHEIIRYPEITRLPNTPPYIKGVINLRGTVVPVVDVRERFDVPKGSVTELTRIIVIETIDKLIGMLVDSVYQVVRLPLSHIDPPSELIEGISEEFIKGIGRLKDRLIIILNPDSMLFDEEKKAL